MRGHGRPSGELPQGHVLGDPNRCVLFVGYQAQGRPGRDILTYGPRNGWVELDGQRYDIKSEVVAISGHSAHADRKGLLNFVRRMRHWPKEVRLVHGERRAQEALKADLKAMAAAKGHPMRVTFGEPAGV